MDGEVMDKDEMKQTNGQLPLGDDSGDDSLEKSSEEVAEVADTLGGRDKLLNRFKEAHADFDGDPSDDDLYGYADSAFGERDEYKGKYDALNGANEKLAEVIREEPSVARFIGMIANGSHPIYAIGKCFGDLIDTLDDSNLEELEKGMDERRGMQEEIKKNFEKYSETLKAYLKENNLSDEDGTRINDTILDIAEALTRGEIDRDVIDCVYKGLDYDTAKDSELEAAKLAGKNEAIDAVKNKRSGGSGVPDVVERKSASPVVNRFPEPKKVESLSEAVRSKE